MSKVCVATWFSSIHDFEPGTERARRRAEADMYEVCGEKRGHWRHRGACENGCGRVAKSGGEYCCGRCAERFEHSAKCDEREANRAD